MSPSTYSKIIHRNGWAGGMCIIHGWSCRYGTTWYICLSEQPSDQIGFSLWFPVEEVEIIDNINCVQDSDQFGGIHWLLVHHRTTWICMFLVVSTKIFSVDCSSELAFGIPKRRRAITFIISHAAFAYFIATPLSDSILIFEDVMRSSGANFAHI